ncbi:caskin-2-like isoform X1 [Centruroides vittatus]|uniref:caskin-2-like isoform X1 n=2 Tax=Centruroides vittatus TaxID=120091 RepID=UPI00351046FB
MPRKLLVGGNKKTGTLKSTIKKVTPPIVPGITNRSISTNAHNQSNNQSVDETDYGGICASINVENLIQVDATLSSTHATLSSVDSQMEDQGIEVEASPGRESPGGSSVGCLSRHSTASVDSGRCSITCSEIKNPPRISAQNSESGQVLNTNVEDCVNVAEMLVYNLPENEILKSWLSSVHFEEYVPLFVQAGYDMPTVSRMTPEDLTAVGITKPMHRRTLKAEIAKLNISDGIPNYKPNTLLEWLQLLRLEDYHNTLCKQGYDTIDRVTELAWEDLEEIGIQKLGHQKKIMLAIKRIQDINSGIRKPNLNPVPEYIGRGTLPRPQTLGPMNPLPAVQCHGQEIAITTVKVKTSPSAEISTFPELKTFQYSPMKGESFRWPGNGDSFSPVNAVNNFEPQMVDIQVQSPNRRHSLENLDKGDSIPSSHHHYINNSDSWYDTISAWRHHGYDTDSELSTHGEHCYLYESDGTATLQRPKGLVKPRPVAKIIAKSRQNNQINDLETVKNLKYNGQKTDQISVESSQQANILSTNFGTLKYKKTPPPPPKRSNSIKSDSSVERTIEAMKDEAFATCVKGLASHFNIAKNNEVSSNSNQIRAVQGNSEEFPPPPPPLPVIEVDTKPSVSTNSYNDSEQKEVPELFSNAMFKQRRKHSLDSTVSSSESNTLPFANENVSTIKQKINKPQVSETKSPSPSIIRKTTLTIQGNKTVTAKRRNGNAEEKSEEYALVRKLATTSEDVIDDIEHMLTNLSNQLDAMLEDEKLMKDGQ